MAIVLLVAASNKGAVIGVVIFFGVTEFFLLIETCCKTKIPVVRIFDFITRRFVFGFLGSHKGWEEKKSAHR